jgi:3-keto-5-aminohexanoate cleavage enzyme
MPADRQPSALEKLVITVTVDSTMSYPGNPAMPPIEDVEAVAAEYVRAIDAGASIVHHHGVHHLEKSFQSDGRKLSQIDFDGWARLTASIRSQRGSIIQFGIASARLEDKLRLLELQPEMMSYAFNVHDEFFQPDERFPPNEQYSLHPRDELLAFCRAAAAANVKPEVESFYTGAFWNLEYVRRFSALEDPVWTTLFLGWPGGAWTPPTLDALLYLLRHLPARVNWNTSVMDPVQQWPLLAAAIGLGGHVRVGWEDNPYLPDGKLARSNAELVEVAVQMARSMGREVASPDEARLIVGTPRRSQGAEAGNVRP